MKKIIFFVIFFNLFIIRIFGQENPNIENHSGEHDSIQVEKFSIKLLKDVDKLHKKKSTVGNYEFKAKLDSLKNLSKQLLNNIEDLNYYVPEDYLNALNSNARMLKKAKKSRGEELTEILDDLNLDLSAKLSGAESLNLGRAAMHQKVKIIIEIYKFENNRLIPAIAKVKANNWGTRNNNQPDFDFGVASHTLEINLMAGLYDIWLEEMSEDSNNLKLPKKRSKQIITFPRDSNQMLIKIVY